MQALDYLVKGAIFGWWLGAASIRATWKKLIVRTAYCRGFVCHSDSSTKLEEGTRPAGHTPRGHPYVLATLRVPSLAISAMDTTTTWGPRPFDGSDKLWIRVRLLCIRNFRDVTPSQTCVEVHRRRWPGSRLNW